MTAEPPDTRFQDAMKEWGEPPGCKHLHTNTPLLDKLIAACESRVRWQKDLCPTLANKSVLFDVIENSVVDAFAATYKGAYLVGINAGVLFKTNAVFFSLLANRSVLPQIGNVSLEDESVGYSVFEFWDDLKHDFVVPKCPERRLKAFELTIMACCFCIDHEFGHILNGHVDYLGIHGIRTYLNETVRLVTNESRLERQTLELNADSYAARCMMLHLDGLKEGKMPSPEFLRCFHEICFAVSVFCRLFGQATIYDFDMNKKDHPPWRMRILTILSTIATIAKESWKLSPANFELVDNLMRDAFVHCEYLFQVIDDDPDSITSMLVYRNSGYTQELTSYWTTTLRGKLLPFAMGPLPP